jgi:hypothetical protein
LSTFTEQLCGFTKLSMTTHIFCSTSTSSFLSISLASSPPRFQVSSFCHLSIAKPSPSSSTKHAHSPKPPLTSSPPAHNPNMKKSRSQILRILISPPSPLSPQRPSHVPITIHPHKLSSAAPVARAPQPPITHHATPPSSTSTTSSSDLPSVCLLRIACTRDVGRDDPCPLPAATYHAQPYTD